MIIITIIIITIHDNIKRYTVINNQQLHLFLLTEDAEIRRRYKMRYKITLTSGR